MNLTGCDLSGRFPERNQARIWRPQTKINCSIRTLADSVVIKPQHLVSRAKRRKIVPLREVSGDRGF